MSWGGRMITTGTVSASITINGTTYTPSEIIYVGRRSNLTWWGNIDGRQGNQGEVDQCWPVLNPPAGIMTGQSCTATNNFLLFTPEHVSNGAGYAAAQVAGTGINGGLYYVNSASATMQLRTQIKRELRTDATPLTMTGDPIIVAACGGPTARTTYTVNTVCQSVAAYSNFVTFAWAHEGRHLNAALVEGNQLRSDVHVLWEPLVANDLSALQTLARDVYADTHNRIALAAQNSHTGTPFSYSFWRHVGSGWFWAQTSGLD
jgi:hypothetical protein